MTRKPFWRRRREALALRQPRPFVEDPENGDRKRDCEQQMRLFDALSAQRRAQIANAHDNEELQPDVDDVRRRLELRGPSDRVRRIIKDRGLVPCDVPFDELLELERGAA